MSTPAQILVIYAHAAPHRSRINRRLADAARALPHVRVHDLYATYPDFYIDVAHEQALAAQADLIVFLHPIVWYSMPSLLKEWCDVVLEAGWAYGEGATGLKDKGFLLAATTGGALAAYCEEGVHGHDFGDFLPPFVQTARLCGMRWQTPLVLHGAHHVGEADIAAHVAAFCERLNSYVPAVTEAA